MHAASTSVDVATPSGAHADLEWPSAEMEAALRAGIATNALTLRYQPIVDLGDGSVVGHEALVRWRHPVEGLLGPGRFIPLAERTGLIVPLGEWVLREACRQAALLCAASHGAELTMSVNLSAAQLNQQGLADVVEGALAEAGLRPGQLHLEVTESVAGDEVAMIAALEQLRALGVVLCMDDFGTGYSSLGHLKRMPVSILKIDKAFVADLGRTPDDSAIFSAIVSLADALNLTTVAEGVETERQRDHARRLGCDLAQGFFYGGPMTADDAAAHLAATRARVVAPHHRPALVPAGQTDEVRMLGAHSAHLHPDGSGLVETMGRQVATALRHGDTTLVLATRETRERVEATLVAAGLDAGQARIEGCLHHLDVVEVVALASHDGRLLPSRVDELLRSELRRLTPGRRTVVVSDGVSLLWAQGRTHDALALESCFDHLTAQVHGTSVTCHHLLSQLAAAGSVDEVASVVALHTLAVPHERRRAGLAPTRHVPERRAERAVVEVAADDTEARLAALSRRLLWADSVDEVEQTLIDLVTDWGGGVAPLGDDLPADAMPVNLAVGGGPPRVPVAGRGTVARMRLERHLPVVIGDATRVASLLTRWRDAEDEMTRDFLTGIANRRLLARTMGRLEVGDALVLLDLDHFKEVNDVLGHKAGDDVLQRFAVALQAAAGPLDLVGRYGGEEFLALLRQGDPPAFCDRLARAWAEQRPAAPGWATFSGGWARVEHDAPPRAALLAADARLYRAKSGGRDRVVGPDTARVGA